MGRAAGSFDIGKRQAILAAARELLNRPGHRTTVSEVSRTSGVSRQTIYKHFGGLGGLVDQVLAERRDCPTCPQAADGPPRATLERYAARLWSWFSEASDRAAVLQQQPRPAGLLQLRTLASLDRAAESLARFLADEAALGRLDVRHAPAAAELFLTLVAGRLVLSRAELTAHGAAEDEARACARLFFRAHGPRASTPPLPLSGRAHAPIIPLPQERAS